MSVLLPLFLAVLRGTGDEGPSSPAADRQDYHSLAARAGRDADGHARLALWCEAHHLEAESRSEINEALKWNPDDQLARALRGEIHDRDRWRTAQEVARQQDEPRRASVLGEYDRRRAASEGSVQDNLELASWCAGNGLRAEELAHLTAVIRRDPKHAEAWRKLGYHLRDGVWVDAAHEPSRRQLHAQAREAYHRWTVRLKELLRERADRGLRGRVDAELEAIRDPQAVPAIALVAHNGSIEDRQLAAKLLGQIDGPQSTSRLTWMALLDVEGPVRGAAADALARRDPREFIGPVIDYLRKPPTVEIEPIGGPGDPGRIEVEGMRPRVYAIPTMAEFRVGTGNLPVPIDTSWLSAMASRPLGSMDTGGYSYTLNVSAVDPAVAQAFTQLAAHPSEAAPILRGLAGLAAGNHSSPPPLTYRVVVPPQHNYAAARYSRSMARIMQNQVRNYEINVLNRYNSYCADVRKQFAADSKLVRSHVDTIERTSRNALSLLQQVTGLVLGNDHDTWSAWWAGWNRSEPGIGQEPASVAPTAAAGAAAPSPAADRAQVRPHRPRLATGTLVWTSRGQKPVESLRVGDLVLVQDPARGRLGYQGVVAVTAPETDAVERLRLDQGTPILVSPIESVWKASAGWVHAGDLHAGDAVRILGGRATVVTADPDPDAPVINVVLDDEGTLFAGEAGLLVHDNSIVHPPSQPFDAVPRFADDPTRPQEDRRRQIPQLHARH